MHPLHPPPSRRNWSNGRSSGHDQPRARKLLAAHGPADTKRLIEILDNYKGATGKRYASDYRAILSWVVDRLREEKGRTTKPDLRNNGAPGEFERQRWSG